MTTDTDKTEAEKRLELAFLMAFRKAYKLGELQGWWAGLIGGTVFGALGLIVLQRWFGL